MMRTLIKNATIVNEGSCRKGSILIDGEIIVDIFEGNIPELEDIDRTIDATGLFLTPGVIDDHVHFRDPGLTHKADMESESRAAAAGGVTSIFDMPNTVPQTTTIEALNEKFAHAATCCHVNYSFFFGATNDNSEQIELIDKKRVCGIKVFMGSSTGNMLVDDAESLRTLFQKAKMPIMAHCEDTETINQNVQKVKNQFGDDAPIELHPEIRSREACFKSTKKAVDLAKETGAQLHIAHITTEEELKLFTKESITDKKITAEVCPAHLIFCETDYAEKGTLIKCNPAVKSASDRQALREAILDGRIDVIGTDHAPHTLDEKQGGCLKAVSGMPMIQFSLVSMLTMANECDIAITAIIEKMCHAPARLFNIDRRGFIRKGYYADLALVSPTKWTLTNDLIESKCKWSPLEGETFKWKVEATFCNGNMIFNGKEVDCSSRGQAIEFNR